MKWYERFAQLSSKQPSYLVERQIDLKYIRKICSTNPSKAKKLLEDLSQKFLQHFDDEFAQRAIQISKIVLDNPSKAKELIFKMIISIDSLKR